MRRAIKKAAPQQAAPRAEKWDMVEAQRITSCFETAMDKLHILALMREGGSEGDSSDLLKMRSDETGRLLHQHGTLMKQFQENISTRRSLTAASRALQRANEQQLSETAGSLGHATKSLTRSLQENVDLQGNMNKMHAIAHETHRLLAITVQELAEPHGCKTTLEETTEIQHQVRTNMADTMAREKKLSASVAKLRAELAAQTLDMETEIGLKDLKLAHFKDKLVNQRHDVTMMLSYMSKDSAANTQTTRRHWARHVQELKDEIAKCEDQLQVEQVSHAAQVKFLEAKIKKCTERKLLTEQINNGQTSNTLKAQGVKDPKEQEQLIELMEEGRKELLHKLLELQDKYDQDVARRALTAESERKEREEEAARAAGQQRSTEAAVVLQCSYRMHLARLLLDATKNPKKGKKKKK